MKLEVDLSETIYEQLKELANRAWSEAFINHSKLQNYPDYMSLGEACKYLDISRNTLSKFIETGLMVTKIDKVKRIAKKDIQKFMDENK